MDHIPAGKNMKKTYENFTAGCPWCGRENIFNRASDLKDSAPIDHLDVICFHCEKPFYLAGDDINPAYEMMIFDCDELKERKHYAYCILNLAQAFEVFFSQFLLIQLLYKSYASDPDKDIHKLNTLIDLLYEKTKKLSFYSMRNLFFFCVLDSVQPTSLAEAKKVIDRIPYKPPRHKPPRLRWPTDEDITGAKISANTRIRDLLLQLRFCGVPTLRNDVVHKRAKRPTLEEVNGALNETREILFVLPRALGVHSDDINWYCENGK